MYSDTDVGVFWSLRASVCILRDRKKLDLNTESIENWSIVSCIAQES